MSKKLKEGGLGDLAHAAERDHEVQMARADLYKIAKYAIKLHDMLKTVSEAEGIEGWQQSKITKAADYIGSVYHAMDYDTKFAESKSTKNVMKRSKTMTEKSYLESMQEKVNKTLKKSLKQLVVSVATQVILHSTKKQVKRKKAVMVKYAGKAIGEVKAIAVTE